MRGHRMPPASMRIAARNAWREAVACCSQQEFGARLGLADRIDRYRVVYRAQVVRKHIGKIQNLAG